MRVDDTVIESMVEAMGNLIECIEGLTGQIMQYESIEEVEEWLPGIRRVAEYKEDYGCNKSAD